MGSTDGWTSRALSDEGIDGWLVGRYCVPAVESVGKYANAISLR